jgi:hypothetical protein
MNKPATPPVPVDPAADVLNQPAQRHDGWTPERQRAFCEMLAECGSVEHAAAAVGMSRETAYRLRRRRAGRAFALAWDAALLLARQRLIDDVFDLAFAGSVERHYRDGKLIAEKRKRDPRALLATIERLGTNKALGTGATNAVAQDFEEFLDCMDSAAAQRSGAAAQFMANRAAQSGILNRDSLLAAHGQLSRMRTR